MIKMPEKDTIIDWFKAGLKKIFNVKGSGEAAEQELFYKTWGVTAAISSAATMDYMQQHDYLNAVVYFAALIYSGRHFFRSYRDEVAQKDEFVGNLHNSEGEFRKNKISLVENIRERFKKGLKRIFNVNGDGELANQELYYKFWGAVTAVGAAGTMYDMGNGDLLNAYHALGITVLGGYLMLRPNKRSEEIYDFLEGEEGVFVLEDDYIPTEYDEYVGYGDDPYLVPDADDDVLILNNLSDEEILEEKLPVTIPANIPLEDWRPRF